MQPCSRTPMVVRRPSYPNFPTCRVYPCCDAPLPRRARACRLPGWRRDLRSRPRSVPGTSPQSTMSASCLVLRSRLAAWGLRARSTRPRHRPASLTTRPRASTLDCSACPRLWLSPRLHSDWASTLEPTPRATRPTGMPFRRSSCTRANRMPRERSPTIASLT